MYIELDNGQIMETREEQIIPLCWNKSVKCQQAGNILTFSFETWEKQPLSLEPVNVQLSGDIVAQKITVNDGVLELAGAVGDLVVVETVNASVNNVRLEVVLV